MLVTEERLATLERHRGDVDYVAELIAEVRCLRAAIEFVLADAESQHPGGWGPDVTMVGVLKNALKGGSGG